MVDKCVNVSREVAGGGGGMIIDGWPRDYSQIGRWVVVVVEVVVRSLR